MQRLPLIGGSYSARSIIASCQRCINLFPEINPKDSIVPVTHYQRSGLRPLVSGPAAPVRGVFRASNDNGYCVIGQNVYSVSTDWQLTLLGTLQTIRTTPVSMTDNGITLLLVDGSQYGYTIEIDSNTFGVFNDPTGLFQGADRVDYLDTFTLFNFPGTNRFGSTLSNTLDIDPLYFAAKTTYPDALQSLIVNKREILLIGKLKTEIWFNAGLQFFPFTELPGAYFEHGTVAKYSIASQDIAVYWLGQDLQGQGIVFRAKGYDCKRISNHALEYQIGLMAAEGTISDAIGLTFQQGGHVFYALCFPSGDQTWLFDESTEQWCQWAWTGQDGLLHRHRMNCGAFLHGLNVVGDWENGTIYAQDIKVHTDTVAGVSGPISFVRTFPHIGITAILNQVGTQSPMNADGKRVQYGSFVADIECGNGPLDANGNPATIALRWSDDRGKTWGTEILQSSGAPGEWITQPKWAGMLGVARDRVFELQYSINGEAALNGAWVDAKVLAS